MVLNVLNWGYCSNRLKGLSLLFVASLFHALLCLPEQPIRVISLTDKPLPILHAQSAKKPPTRPSNANCAGHRQP